jgi:hypothetical protein
MPHPPRHHRAQLAYDRRRIPQPHWRRIVADEEDAQRPIEQCLINLGIKYA